jgi:hypothetical protein
MDCLCGDAIGVIVDLLNVKSTINLYRSSKIFENNIKIMDKVKVSDYILNVGKSEDGLYELLVYASMKKYFDVIDDYFCSSLVEKLINKDIDNNVVYYYFDKTFRYKDVDLMEHFMKYAISKNDKYLLNKIIYCDIHYLTRIIELLPGHELYGYYRSLCKHICFCSSMDDFVHLLKNEDEFYKCRTNMFIIENDKIYRKGMTIFDPQHECSCNAGTDDYVYSDYQDY